MATKTYTVSGMTCDHCARAVRTEVSTVPGVFDVEVDLATGALVVGAQAPLDDLAVAAAVEEAGYELVEAGV